MMTKGVRPATLWVSEGMFGFSCAAFGLCSMLVQVFACISLASFFFWSVEGVINTTRNTHINGRSWVWIQDITNIVYSIEKLYTLSHEILCYLSFALFINSQTLILLFVLMGLISLHYHLPCLTNYSNRTHCTSCLLSWFIANTKEKKENKK